MSARLTSLLVLGAAGAIVGGLGSAACDRPVRRATLPPAGSAADDGSGQLAGVSARAWLGRPGEISSGWGERRDAAASGADSGWGYGGGYGGDGYGGGAYGNYVTPPPIYGGVTTLPAYVPIATADGGAIEGEVRWPRSPEVPTVLALPGCDPVANDSLILGRGATVAGAVVYLERIDHGRAVPVGQRPLQVGGAIERRGCGLWPRVQVLGPVAATLQLYNGDREVLGLRVESQTAGVAAVERQVDPGGAASVAVVFAGVLRVTDIAGRLPPAWVIAEDHPYHTVTDSDGRFRLDEIPPGSYTLVAWHAPPVVAVTRGVPIYGAPVVVTQRVQIGARAVARVVLSLPPAPRATPRAP